MEHIEVAVVVVMVLFNAVFAAYEIALASISVARLQALTDEGRRGASSALWMKQEIEKSLAVVQLGITAVGLFAGATGGASATGEIAPYLREFGLSVAAANVVAMLLVVLPLTAATIVIGELVPKLFALRNKEWVCLRLSPPMRLFAASMWPIVWILEASASGLMDLAERFWRPSTHASAREEAAELQELRAIASLARASRLIGAREENIILGAARLASRPLREIMLPVEHIRMLRSDDSLAKSLVAAHLDMHTRFPVAESPEDPQTIVGYVTFKDIVSMMRLSPEATSIRSVLRNLPSLGDSLPLSHAMEHLLREHTHIALVRDAQSRVVGMITLEDIVEEMIGDIQDEYDLLPLHIVRAGNGWVVGGAARLDRLLQVTGIELPTEHPTSTINAWMIERLGRVPRGGDLVKVGAIQVLVRKVRRQRVLEASLFAREDNVHSQSTHVS